MRRLNSGVYSRERFGLQGWKLLVARKKKSVFKGQETICSSRAKDSESS